MLALAGQVTALIFMVGGIFVSALALSDPARKRCIIGFSLLGAGNLILIIYTYEQTPGVPHLFDAWAWALGIAAAAWSWASVKIRERTVLGVLAFICGAILSAGLIRVALQIQKTRPKPDKRQWLSSYKIFDLADPQLMKEALEAEGKYEHIQRELEEFAQRREALRPRFKDPGEAIIAMQQPPSPALEALAESAKEAYIESTAQQQQRTIARRKALEDLYEKLRNGTLIAKGFRHPVRSKSMEMDIPAAHWRIIRFNGDYTQAEGQGIKFLGITVAKAD